MPSAAPTDSTECAGVGNGWLDFGAIALSALCLVHCLALPLLAVLLPVLATGPLADERLHLWLLAAVVPTSLIAFWLGVRRHRHARILIGGGLGLALVAAAALGRHAGWFGEAGDRWLTVSGGLLLAAAHWHNYRLMHAGHHHGPGRPGATRSEAGG